MAVASIRVSSVQLTASSQVRSGMCV